MCELGRATHKPKDFKWSLWVKVHVYKSEKPYVIVVALYATHIKLLLTTTILHLKFLTIRVFPIHFCYGYIKIIQIWLIKAFKNVEKCTVCEENADIKISTRDAFLELLSSDTLIYANLGTIGDSWRKVFFAKFRNNRWFFEEGILCYT